MKDIPPCCAKGLTGTRDKTKSFCSCSVFRVFAPSFKFFLLSSVIPSPPSHCRPQHEAPHSYRPRPGDSVSGNPASMGQLANAWVLAWLAALLAAWLAAGLVALLAAWLADWLPAWLAALLVAWLITLLHKAMHLSYAWGIFKTS